MNIKLLVEALMAAGWQVKHTGSRAICDNPPENSDDDWVVYQPELNVDEMCEVLGALGFKTMQQADQVQRQEDYDPSTTVPMVSADNKVNLIVATSGRTFDLWSLATDKARALGLKSRAERVKLFHEVLYPTLQRPEDDKAEWVQLGGD